MHPVRRQSLAEQTAAHLQQDFLAGRWSGHLPGVARLAEALGVSRGTIREALHLLEDAGALQHAGAGKRRHIVARRERQPRRRVLRVAILLNLPLAEDNSHSQQLFLLVRGAIEAAGHVCFIAERSLSQLGWKSARVAMFVRATQADAWIVYAATHDVLAWFAAHKIPTLAVGGHAKGLAVASTRTDLSGAIEATVDALAAHGHRRIVMICPGFWNRPAPNSNASAFLARLRHFRITPGDYNLPEWKETSDGLQQLLASLFSATPPTALLICDPMWTAATLGYLSQRKLRVPQDVSIIGLLSDPVFSMHRPVIAHFDWPLTAHVRRAQRWVEAVALGRVDQKQCESVARFIPGGTIGPVKR